MCPLRCLVTADRSVWKKFAKNKTSPEASPMGGHLQKTKRASAREMEGSLSET